MKLVYSMRLYKEFNINLDKKGMICFVGAGGKTSAMFGLAKELKSLGKKILVTTTTYIYNPNAEDCDDLTISPKINYNNLFFAKKGSITVIGKELTKENKLKGFEAIELDQLFMKSYFDYILVEGDGSKRRSIKAPGSYEPVIPSATEYTIGVIGIDCIGKQINERNVHRVQEFCHVVDGIQKSIIDEK